MKWLSVAWWPRPEVELGNTENISTDSHDTKDQAYAVVKILVKEGFGGDGKIFPLKTAVVPQTIDEVSNFITNKIPTDLKEGEIITRKWKGGKIIEETREQSNWKPNAADLDIIQIRCECGNQFDTPRDSLMFLNSKNSFCGQCGESGKMVCIV